MNWNRWIRETHRWLSVIFVVIVVIVSLAAVQPEPPAEWVFYLPLPPLFLLMLTGLYLFVLPYAAKWRSGGRPD